MTISYCLKRCINPLLLCLPATFASSFAFMFPVSACPNAIAYEATGMRIIDMIKVGGPINIALMLVTIGCTLSYGVPLFDLLTYPEWAFIGKNSTCI